MKRTWENVNTSVGNQSESISDKVDLLKIKDTKGGKKTIWTLVRFVGEIYPYAEHWISILSKEGKEFKIRKPCLAYNSESDDFSNRCPYCELEGKIGKKRFLSNVIDREAQEGEPKKAKKPSKEEIKRGFRHKDDDSWSPIRVTNIPLTLASKIKATIELNKHKIKDKKTGEKKIVSCDIADSKYGCDIAISFDSTKKGGDMYNIQKQEHTPLTDDEKEYLLFDLEDAITTEDLDTAEKEAKKLKAKLDPSVYGTKDDYEEDEDIDEDDVIDDEFENSKSKSKKSKKSKYDDDDEDDYKSKKSKSKKSKYDDEDNDDDDYKSKKSKSKKRKK